MIKKKDGTYRCCLDFWNINKVTLFNVKPMPEPEDIFARMSKDLETGLLQGLPSYQNGG